MSDGKELKALIRHVSGAKANQIEEFRLEGRDKIRIGRDAACDVVFDNPRDDVVSRNHAVILVDKAERLSFFIEDLASSNGTFLNKKRLKEKSELLPDDTVTCGQNGPSFIFDVDPRPASLAARTRLIDAASPTTTRVLSAAEAASAASTAINMVAGGTRSTSVVDTSEGQPGKVGIGHATLLHEIARERSAANRSWLAVLGALAVVVMAGGGALYWSQLKSEKAQEVALDQARQDVQDQGSNIRRQFGMSPEDIVRQYGPATAKLSVQWRLYDQNTGRPIFIKTAKLGDQKYPVYAKLPDGSIVPWLTLEDEGRQNIAVSGDMSGTAFVVSEQGYLLTNKHLAADWQLPFYESPFPDVLLVERSSGRGNSLKFSKINLSDKVFNDIRQWAPSNGGVVFAATSFRVIGAGRIPDPSQNVQHDFSGRNDVLNVTFPGKRLPINATLVRSSLDSDVALIKIDSPQNLRKVEIDSTSLPSTGERAMVLGFPAIAVGTVAVSDSIENGMLKKNATDVPLPYVTEGIIALISNKMTTEKGVTVAGVQGDVMQLTINSTGAGNSGGPVFNANGKAIGIFAYGYSQGSTQNTGAVPIKYGTDLLQSQ